MLLLALEHGLKSSQLRVGPLTLSQHALQFSQSHSNASHPDELWNHIRLVTNRAADIDPGVTGLESAREIGVRLRPKYRVVP